MEHASPTPTASLSQRKWKLSLALIGVTVLLVAVAGVYGTWLRPPPLLPPGIPSSPHMRKASAHFQEAKDLVREGKWTEARARLLELQAMAPEFTPLEDYLAFVERELPNQEHLRAAQAALEQRDLATARAELDKVRKDTVLFEKVQHLRRLLNTTAASPAGEAQAPEGQLPPPPP
jgi:hypothetical protein